MINVPVPENMSGLLAKPGWDSRSGALSFTLPGGRVVRFKISAEVNDKMLSPADWDMLPDGGAKGLADGFGIQVGFKAVEGRENSLAVVASIINLTPAKVKFGGFHFSAVDKLLPAAGPDLRIYKEGWAMTSPAASVRYGEKEFFLNPDYKPFATSVPATYDDNTPNRYDANYAVVLNDKSSGETVLAGFISSENQVTRFALELDAQWLSSFEAVCDGDGIEFAYSTINNWNTVPYGRAQSVPGQLASWSWPGSTHVGGMQSATFNAQHPRTFVETAPRGPSTQRLF